MKSISLAIPVVYFIRTRLNTKAAILFHGVAEYLLGVLMLIYFGIAPIAAIKDYFLSYLAFISLYEVGYILNDFVSTQFEKNPRKRLSELNPSALTVTSWIAIRVAFFLAISFHLKALGSQTWMLFYSMLTLIFAFHNILERKEYKILTFCGLAFTRFYAPVFLFLPFPLIVLSFPGIFLHYVLFRTLTYADSKGLLNILNRGTLSFKCMFYCLFLPLSAIISCLSNNWLCLWINLYFLVFWGSIFLLNKLHFIKLEDVKAE